MPKLTKTVRCKLKPGAKERKAMLETIRQFSNACNYISEIAHENGGVSNKVALHHMTYRGTRKRFGLPAQLACTARDKVAESYKRDSKKKLRHFGPNTSVRLDARTFSIAKDGRASISSVKGRVKVPMILGEFQQSLLKSWEISGAADLVYSKQTKIFYIHIIVKKEVDPPAKTGKRVGVDIGMANLATTSNSLKYSGKQAMHIRRHYRKLRNALQAKGTHEAKKLLKRLRGKEVRTMRDLNHRISRGIVNSLQAGDVIVMEKLTHIRERAKQRKSQRADFHNWTFSQLQDFIKYKALEQGIAVEYINPAYTSQTCSRCGSLGSRSQHHFSCSICGLHNHADFNASYNIAGASLASSDGPQSIGPKATHAEAEGSFEQLKPSVVASPVILSQGS